MIVGERMARLRALGVTASEVADRSRAIYRAVLDRSSDIRSGNFEAISTDDLDHLFDLYDAASFGGLLGTMLRQDRSKAVAFRLSSRLTSTAGKTTMFRERGRTKEPPWYEIAISSTLLFQTFKHVERPVEVAGVVCLDRLEALQRIFEHELLHLAEYLATGASNCSDQPFRSLANSIFGHQASKHNLVTPREVAAVTHAIRPGDLVGFDHAGRRLVGRVNRITRRATILVEDPAGLRFSDGKRYLRFYVPLTMLKTLKNP